MMPRQHRSPERLRLAAALKVLREGTGESAARFGERFGWSQGKVSKIENARTVPSPDDVEAWAESAGAPADEAASLAALAETVATETHRWRGRQHGNLTARNQDAAEAEADSDLVRVFQPAVIPGLLQTADYARHVMTMLGTADDRDLAAAVNVRMQRQDILYHGKPFEFVLTEAALRWRPGPAEMMVAQYDRLLTVATLPTVDLRVLPLSRQAPTLYLAGYTLYEIPDAPYVRIELLTGESLVRDEGGVAAYRAEFERSRDAALAGEDAASLVRALR